MKKLPIILAGVAVLFAGIIIGCMIKCCGNKIAVVDIMSVVNKSAQVEELKNKQTAKTQELAQWLQKVQDEVKAEKDKKKQEELLQDYNTQFVQKREEIAKEYNEALQAIDNDITNTIIKIAKGKGYKVVLSKGAIVHGGDDITEEVLKVIK